jgi:hypothetical protein
MKVGPGPVGGVKGVMVRGVLMVRRRSKEGEKKRGEGQSITLPWLLHMCISWYQDVSPRGATDHSLTPSCMVLLI